MILNCWIEPQNWVVCFLPRMMISFGELSNSKTDLLPHQILLTHQVVNARRRKFLIADEVGLGKTIEVGMIIKELLSRNEAKRVLIICPAGLTVNWQNEMKDCFRIFFDIFGRDFSGANPHLWERHNSVIIEAPANIPDEEKN